MADPIESEYGTEQHNSKYETLGDIEQAGKAFMQAVTTLEFRSAQNPKYTANTVEDEAATAARNGILYPSYFIPQGDKHKIVSV